MSEGKIETAYPHRHHAHAGAWRTTKQIETENENKVLPETVCTRYSRSMCVYVYCSSSTGRVVFACRVTSLYGVNTVATAMRKELCGRYGRAVTSPTTPTAVCDVLEIYFFFFLLFHINLKIFALRLVSLFSTATGAPHLLHHFIRKKREEMFD